MNSFLILAVIAGVLCFAVDPVHSIKCYTCKAGAKNCAETEEFDCSTQPTWTRCLKTISGDVVSKSCSPPISDVPDDKECKDIAGTTTCICTKDLCNGASAQYTSMAVLLGPLSAALVTVKWML